MRATHLNVLVVDDDAAMRELLVDITHRSGQQRGRHTELG